jgi:Protein of unknown function (DUF3047)
MGLSDFVLVRPRFAGLFAALQALVSVAASVLFAAMLVLLSACATPTTPRLAAAVHDLSDPVSWEPWVLHPSKRTTVYENITIDGMKTVRARADRSASGLRYALNLDVSDMTELSWKWRVDSLIEGADLTVGHSEDSPVRIVLAFDGDKGSLPGRDQAFFERVKLFTGQELPYATLMYVWENRKSAETVLINPHTSRVRKIVASSGANGLKTWKSFKRKVAQDYQRAYGTKPGRLIGIALLTDTDNTGEKTQAYYSGLTLTR